MKADLLPLALLFIASTAAFPAAPPVAHPPYVAHEWGTFTSVQGADGVQMFWDPLTAVELPRFVYPAGALLARELKGKPRVPDLVIAGKLGTVCRQRLETPVIYFYSEHAQDVDVAVDFPEGRITEWYPQAASPARLKTLATDRGLLHPPALAWEKVHLAAPEDAPAMLKHLPQDQSGSHYFAARETDANFLEVHPADVEVQTEKFLFYRGTGMFTAPLTVKLEGDDHRTVHVENTSSDALLDLFLFQNEGSRRGWLKIDRLSPGEGRSIPLTELVPVASPAVLTEVLSGQFRKALIQQGLYPKEAAAMVKTWEETWFSEPGTRILYPVSRGFTDRVLPLHLTPAPKDLTRVLVGRAEILTPEAETLMEGAVTRYLAAGEDQSLRAHVASEVQGYGFGRFTEPVLRRVLAQPNRSREFISASWELLEQAAKLDAAAKKPSLTSGNVASPDRS